MKYIPIVGLVIGLILVATTAFAEPFTAQGVFCKTKESAINFVTEWDGENAVEVVTGINIAKGEEDCILAVVAIEEVERTIKIKTDQGYWQMVQVNVWAVSQGQFSIYLPESVPMFTFIKVPMQDS